MFEMKMSYARLLFGGLLLPVIIPWIIYQLFFSWKYTVRQRQKFENKVVLLTGASSGLGEALAYELYRQGCKVILASRRLDELERVRKRLIASSLNKESFPAHTPRILQLDLSDLNEVPLKVQEALLMFGRIDILINNGGVSHRGDIMGTAVDVDVKIMVVNYFGQVAITKAVLPAMIRNRTGGHIVGISSIQGKLALPFRSSYAASKHAFQAFFDSLRAETHDNIKVTVVSPGYMKTNLSLNALTGDGNKYGIMDNNTATGMEPEVAAQKILQAIVLEKQEVLLAPFLPYAVVKLRNLCPNTYFSFIRRKAKQQYEKIDSESKKKEKMEEDSECLNSEVSS